MPNFELWHSWRKWAIYFLLFLAWDNDMPTWVFLFRVGWCVVLWTLETHRKSTPPHTHTHARTRRRTHAHTRARACT
jgi:hypothetical protein